jgi:hypothetical protein
MFRPSDCDPPQAIFVRLGRQIENFGQKSPREKSRDWLAQRGFCPILRFGLSVAADKAKYAFCRPIKGESPAKRNHEFESNPLRQPVSLFLSLGGGRPATAADRRPDALDRECGGAARSKRSYPLRTSGFKRECFDSVLQPAQFGTKAGKSEALGHLIAQAQQPSPP